MSPEESRLCWLTVQGHELSAELEQLQMEGKVLEMGEKLTQPCQPRIAAP